jgi:hypothetical protein
MKYNHLFNQYKKGPSPARDAAERGPAMLDVNSGKRIRVAGNDPVFDAVLDVLQGNNVCFSGVTGSGKTMRGEALALESNYPVLLAGTYLEGLCVRVVNLTVDLVPMLANMELVYEAAITDGRSHKDATLVCEFLIRHGYVSQQEYLEHMRERDQALRTGSGEVTIFLISLDDIDRCMHRSLQNSFMKFLSNERHDFEYLKNIPPRFLKLQCVASTNSVCGVRNAKYLAAQGLDLAIQNRFISYHISPANVADILKADMAEEHHAFIDALVAFSEDVRRHVEEGSLAAVGEISLRQLLTIVFQVAYMRVSGPQAAAKLLANVPRASEDGLLAETLLAKYFLGAASRRPRFAFNA